MRILTGFVKPKRMGSLFPLFSDVFDLPLLQVLTPSQLKRSLCMCISWSGPRESLDTPSLWCLHFSPTFHTAPAGLPPQDWGRWGVSVQGSAFPFALAFGKRDRVTIFRELLHVGSGQLPPGKARPLSSSGLGIPVVWHDSMGALSWTRGDWSVSQAIREKSVHPQVKCMLFLEDCLSCFCWH